MSELLSLADVARKAAMSPRTLRSHLGEIRHVRLTPRGKIWIRWSDFLVWLDSKAAVVRQDSDVMGILKKLAG